MVPSSGWSVPGIRFVAAISAVVALTNACARLFHSRAIRRLLRGHY